VDSSRTSVGLRIALPVAGLVCLVVLCSLLGTRPSSLHFALALVIALAVAAVAIAARGLALPGWQLVVPFGSFFVIVVLRDGAGGVSSGFGALLLLPVLWLALHCGRREIAAGLVAYTLAQALPILVIGAPAYPADWRRVLLSAVVAGAVAVTVHRLVRDVESQHRRERERTRAVIESQAHIAAAGLDARSAMERIAQRATELTGGTGAVVEMVDGEDLVYTVATGALEPFVSSRVKRASSLSGLAIARDEVLLCDDAEEDDRVDREMCRRVGLRSMVVVPLRAQREVLGVLKVAAGVPNAFDDTHVETLEVLANVMSSALADAEAYGRVAAANERLLELDRMKDTFVATVSHELRTPLASILLSAEMLADGDAGPLTPEQTMLVATLERNSMRLLGEIENLLAISRIEAGSFTSRLAPMELEPVLRAVADSLRPIAGAADVTLDVQCSGELGEIDADAGQLDRALVNLVSNAIKFTPRGGRVDIDAHRAATTVEIAVSDTGIGIPADEQPRLFERFFRASAADSRSIQGSGLGLAIVKEIVDNHGGQIDLDSEPGSGTRVTLTIPIGRRPLESTSPVTHAAA
jgi:signal transduction histidine kinase